MGWTSTTERLDSAYGWLPWPDSLPPTPLTLLSQPCNPPKSTFMKDHVALVLLPEDASQELCCSLAEMIKNAQVWLHAPLQQWMI